MNGNRQWCRWFQILWLSKPLQTLVPEPFGPLDVLSERKPLSPPCHRNQLAFGVIGNAAVSTTAAEMGVGVGVGGGVVLQPCFLSLRKHRSLCEGKTSLTPRNRDLVLVGWFLQSGPTAAALTDALITRPFWKKKELKVELDTRRRSRGLGGRGLGLPGRSGGCRGWRDKTSQTSCVVCLLASSSCPSKQDQPCSISRNTCGWKLLNK